ncbi:MAG: excinuclease ABC subunit UvrC [Candidatus Eremiobacteraeota bacterium]|nr:excinuclease ABC subunit UvrC [Candidatus Eremiobacteraeota bacterium]MCW5870124.1 excinuclease ABC subunit UvrC [Candidatus Eremiobacteraeota bacterium]
MIAEKLKLLPDKPGVYLMQDAKGRIIYVGKSASLRQRVRSYFQPSSDHAPKIRWMVSKIKDFDTVVVDSELEALILECNLIKKHRPYFNTKYRDDKRYPLLEVTTGEEFPRLRVVRRQRNPRNRYFGPFPDAGALRRTVTILQKMFQIRTCSLDMDKKVKRPCLDYYIGLCTAPCTRYVDAPHYREQVEQAIDYMEGNSDKLLRRLRQEMESEAEALNFERCARIRDMLLDLERTGQKQKMVSDRDENEDYLAVASSGELICAQVLQVREGKLLGHRSFLLESPGGSEAGEQMSAFFKQYYQQNSYIPRRILVSVLPDESELLSQWLSSLSQMRVEIRLPQRGSKRELMELAQKNAHQTLEQENLRPSRGVEQRRLALEELQQALGLSEAPWRMECVDISNFQGRQAVGSLVVFEQGLPRKDQYRRFRIRSGDTPDDFRMMREVLTRRFAHSPDDRRSFDGLPELLIVDGGKGQLGVAMEVLAELGLSDRVALAGLAKENEWIFVPGRSDPVILARTSRALLTVTHMRDETHRFAVTYHRHVRKTAFKQSALDEAPGIGEGRKQALLKHFGSLRKLMAASLAEISQVEGMGGKLSRQLFDYLHTAGELPEASEMPSHGQQIEPQQEKERSRQGATPGSPGRGGSRRSSG